MRNWCSNIVLAFLIACINRKLVILEWTSKAESKPTEMLSDSDKQFMDSMNSLIRKRINDKDFSIDELAASMSMSRSVLYRRLKRIVGQSPNEYINDYRLKLAAELLRKEPEKTVAEIAYECGFSTPQYFSNVFRRRISMTPNEWRKRKNEQILQSPE